MAITQKRLKELHDHARDAAGILFAPGEVFRGTSPAATDMGYDPHTTEHSLVSALLGMYLPSPLMTDLEGRIV